ncbi:MAG: hypothetical protein WEB06_06515 [Actinomycetota bacterium]
MAEELEPNPKISRRTAIRRGAVIGAGVWAVPTISSMRLPAHAQVGSPMPEPSPTQTVTTTPTPTPTETETTVPTPTPGPTVGGVKFVDGADVGGAGLAQTGQNLGAQAIAGGGLVALGLGMKRIASNRLSGHPPAEDPPKSG